MRRKPKLFVENLESRALMSLYASTYTGPAIQPPVLATAGITLNAAGEIHIRGNEMNDESRVWIEGDQVHAELKHFGKKAINGGMDTIDIMMPEPTLIVPVSQVTKIKFWGLGGGDTFENDTSIKSWAYGGDGYDALIGGHGDDYLDGGIDGDNLHGRGGNDSLIGGDGWDSYFFAQLDDINLGSDLISEPANFGIDTLDFSGIAGAINLNLASTAMQSVRDGVLSLDFSTSTAIENVVGTESGDTISDNSRGNVIHGGSGNDTITCGSGPDDLYGEGDDDSLVGGSGNDLLDGGSGNDILEGGDNDDELIGGAHNDHIYTGDGNNTVWDGLGDDHVDFDGNDVAVTFNALGGNDTVLGTHYNDNITGSSGNNRLEGRGGNDTLSGSSGNDTLVSGWGNDSLNDGFGNDRLDFGLSTVGVEVTTDGGNDTVIGSQFADWITGNSGNDLLKGGYGDDKLNGKGGTDELYGEGGSDWMDAGSESEIALGGEGEDYNPYKIVVDGTTYDDIHQEGLPTCAILASLASAAAQNFGLESRITYLGDYNFRIPLFNWENEWTKYETVYFDGTLHRNSAGERIDPSPRDKDEFWPILFQRAYLQMMEANDEDFKQLAFAMYTITGNAMVKIDEEDPEAIASALGQGKCVLAWDADKTDMIWNDHAYVVMDVFHDGEQWWITLYNPHGWDGGAVTQGDKFDGLITMTFEDFDEVHDFDSVGVS